MLLVLEHSNSRPDFGYCRCIKVQKIKGVIHRMNKGRATTPNKIRVEFWKSIGRAVLEWLTRLLIVIFKTVMLQKNEGGV